MTIVDDKPVQPLDVKVADVAPSDKLKDECIGCRLRLSRFSKTKGFDSGTKDEISEAIGMDRSAISGGKRLYDDSHPAIKEANRVINAIHGYWLSITLPLAQAYSNEAAKEGGTRLARRDQVAEIDTRLQAFFSELKTAEQALNAQRADILKSSKELLGNKFDERDYPDKFVLTASWGFPNIEIPSYLAELAPEVYEREVTELHKRLTNSYELALHGFMTELNSVIESWVSALGPVVKLHPPVGHVARGLNDAEVVNKLTPTIDSSVPRDHVKLILKLPTTKSPKAHHALVGDVVTTCDALIEADMLSEDEKAQVELQLASFRNNKKAKSVRIDMTLNSITNEQYQEMRPAEDSTKHRKFHKSTIQNMIDKIAEFRNLGETMSAGPELINAVDAAAKQLQGFNAEDAAKELRGNGSFRADTHELMADLHDKLDSQIVTFQRKRRRITTDMDQSNAAA